MRTRLLAVLLPLLRRCIPVASVLALGTAVLVLTGAPATATAAAAGGDPGGHAGRRSGGHSDAVAVGMRDIPAGADSPTLPAGCSGPGQKHGKPGVCHLTAYDPDRATVVLFGDSHAWMYIPALEKAAKRFDANLVSFVAGSCAPTLIPVSTDGTYPTKCEQNDALAMQWISFHRHRGDALRVVLGSNWTGFRQAWSQIQHHQVDPDAGYTPFVRRMVRLAHFHTKPLFDRLAELAVPTDVMHQAATVPLHAAECPAGDDPYLCDLPRDQAIPGEQPTTDWLARRMAGLAGHPLYIDTTGAYCDADVCHGEADGITTFFDHLHLSATRTRSMWADFLPTYRRAVRAESSGVSAR